MINNYKNIQLLLVLSALCLLLYNILLLKASFFYLLYLYWFDECFRTLGAWLRVRSTKHIEKIETLGVLRGRSAKRIEKIEKESTKTVNNKQDSISTPQSAVNVRIFFLFIYFVFIVFGFGFMFSLFNDSKELLGDNIAIVMLQNTSFNINLGIFLLREIVSYLNDFVIRKRFNAENLMPFPDMIDKQTLVLHLSIIGGGFVWFLSKENLLFGIDLATGKYSYLLVAPFVIIRIIMEIVLFYRLKSSK